MSHGLPFKQEVGGLQENLVVLQRQNIQEELATVEGHCVVCVDVVVLMTLFMLRFVVLCKCCVHIVLKF